MGVSITTSSVAQQTFMDSASGSRAGAVFTNGDILVPVFNDDPNNLEFWLSDDQGATWTHLTGDFACGSGSIGFGAVFIDADDEIHLSWGFSGVEVKIRSGTLSGTTITWGSDWAIESSGGNYPLDLCVWKEGSVKYAAVAHWDAASGDHLHVEIVKRLSTTWSNHEQLTLAMSTTGWSMASVDFHHTGDGKTVQGGTPHIYIAWRKDGNSSCYFSKATWSSGPTWSLGSQRAIFNTGLTTALSYAPIIAFDGTRCVIAARTNSSPYVAVYERDAADTTTTSRMTGLGTTTDTGPEPIDLMVDPATGDIIIKADKSGDIQTNRYDRAGASWGGWTVYANETYTLYDAKFIARNTSGLTKVGLLGTDLTASAYKARYYDADTLNTDPTAPTWTAPTDGSTQDVAAALLLDWVFNDPDAGDTQSAFTVKRTIGATTTYWNGSTWQASEDASTKIATATTSHSMASSWGADGDADHYYSVKTWDAADAGPSPWSSTVRVVPSAKDNPTITAPTPTGTPTVGASELVEWTVSTQTKYRVVVSDTTGGTMDTGTLEYDSGIIIDGAGRSQTASFPTNGVTRYVKVQTWNDEGLASNLDEVDVSVTYTPPSTPTLVNSSNTPAGAITVTVTNPGLGSTEDYNDVYRREGDDATTEIRVATGVAVDGAFIDYTPRSGMVYKYLAKVFGTNGSTADSAWTS